jgi:hypothetical protein
VVVRYEGVLYQSQGVRVAPDEGRRVGTGVLPSCDDGHGASPEEDVELAELAGVSPNVALAWLGRTDVVLVRRGAVLPPEVERLLRAPTCDAEDAPIELTGTWLGILEADGGTELDLKPPYDVDLFVEQASAPRYERTYLTVRIRPALGEPITRADVETSLWKGGSIALRVQCADEGRYVAEEVDASPPS